MAQASGSSSSQPNKQQPRKHDDVVTSIRIAPPSASEKYDHRAIRFRMRRERPQKIRILESNDIDEIEEKRSGDNNFAPDIESFVSNCTPVSIVTETNNYGRSIQSIDVPQRRTKNIRKRSFPVLSFLSSTHLAAAEKKRKKEEKELQDSIAQIEAKKALMLNPVGPAFESELYNEGKKQNSYVVSRGQLPAVEEASVEWKDQDNEAEDGKIPHPSMPMVSSVTEETSNILMPPLLKDFLNQLDSAKKV
mmetsp:Transcript_23695/g.50246  ORF Transcript_23695/g.50246 Transcript_23695/m.50246 type:complete len:249 (+) Transcript_23695:31-777(+)